MRFRRLRITFLNIAHNDEGGAIILALLVSVVVVGLGAVALTLSRGEMREASNYMSGLAAKYHSESALDQVVGLQNNLTVTPRYLFAQANYSYRAISDTDTSRFNDRVAYEPLSGGPAAVGTIFTRVMGKDPLTQSPPYTIESTSVLDDGSSTTYRAVVDVLSLLDFAVFSDDNVWVGTDITIAGRMYSRRSIILTGPNANFLEPVEYVNFLQNSGYGYFQQGYGQVEPLPSIPDLVDLTYYENASKNAGVCGTGRGLYIGTEGPSSVDNQTDALFKAFKGGTPANKSTNSSISRCRYQSPCYLIDLSEFDFSVSPVTYNGVPLVGYDGASLSNFNGVIWSDREIHVFGHLGGRPVEDATVTDSYSYMNPPWGGPNLYSNNTLDSGEDGSNGGVANGQLDPPNKGANLGIYGNNNIYIDHNIWAHTDTAGVPVRMALVARGWVRIDGYSPKAINLDAAVLAVTNSWRPLGNQSSHRANQWARNGGDAGPSTYKFDLDRDGVLESNNGASRSGDRNENSMLNAWTLYSLGNLVVKTPPSSAPWTSVSPAHPRFYIYDTELIHAEIPCYPTLPDYGIVPGSFTEISY